MKNILILGALPEEIIPFQQRWNLMEKQKEGYRRWYGEKWNFQVEAVATGIGKKKSLRFLSAIEKEKYDYLFVAGTAGGCHPDIKKGDFILPRLTFARELEMPLLYEPYVQYYPQPLMTGRHYTADVFMPETDKRKLYKEHGVYSVDMEWSHILSFCLERRLPVFYCKIVADELHTSPPPFWLMRFSWRDLPWRRMVRNLQSTPAARLKQYIHAVRFSSSLRKATDRSVKMVEKILKKISAEN